MFKVRGEMTISQIELNGNIKSKSEYKYIHFLLADCVGNDEKLSDIFVA